MFIQVFSAVIGVGADPISISGSRSSSNNNINSTSESITGKIPKFSIGKDVNETFPDIEDIVLKLNNSNITDDQFINELLNALNITLNVESSIANDNKTSKVLSTTTATKTSTTTTTVTITKPTTTSTTTSTLPKTATTTTTAAPTTETTTITVTTVTITPLQTTTGKTTVIEATTVKTTRVVNQVSTTESLFKKIERARKKLNVIHKIKDKKAIEQLVDDVLTNSDLAKFNKGRKTDDTKAILNYMMTALYSIKQKNADFDTNKFFDEVS